MDCLFCKIINKEISAYKIYEDDLVIAFLDINPKRNGHTLIVPKKHYTDYLELDIDIIKYILEVGEKIANKIMEKLNATGITFAWNYGSTQQIKHFHLHLIPEYETNSDLEITKVFEILTK